MSLINNQGLSYQNPMRRDTVKTHEIVSVVPRDKMRVRFNPEIPGELIVETQTSRVGWR